MVKARKYINQKYPNKEERKKILNLELKEEELEGHLDLSDFTNLEDLDCSNNKLTSLNVNSLTNLIEIDCSNNQLTELDLSSSINLESLNCSEKKSNWNRLLKVKLWKINLLEYKKQ